MTQPDNSDSLQIHGVTRAATWSNRASSWRFEVTVWAANFEELDVALEELVDWASRKPGPGERGH